MTKIAINGFGRIGRNILRALIESGRNDLSVVAINDLAPLETNALLFENDTVHGRFPGPVITGPVSAGGGTLDVGRGAMRVTSERDPAALPWGDVDIVLECTGVFRSREQAALHLANGARRVLISAPAKGAIDKTVVYGVNHDSLTADDVIVSNASCTTNCLAPLAMALHEGVGITRGFVTTIHSYTASQRLLDSAHKDPRRARAAAENIIPTSTGAARAVGKVLPALSGKLDGTAIRVPTPNVSAVDFTFDAARPTRAEEINQILANAASGTLSDVLGMSDKPLVSRDFNHNPLSSIIDSEQTRVTDGTLVRVLAWYDNEWGFSNRMLDTARVIAGHLA